MRRRAIRKRCGTRCLNPYSNGRYSIGSSPNSKRARMKGCLNPYSIGIYSMSYHHGVQHWLHRYTVLILIIVEDTLREHKIAQSCVR